MGSWDEASYRRFFHQLNGFGPYQFQVAVAQRLVAGNNVVLHVPTGAGKTATVLSPFLYPDWQPRPTRLMYALPLRTLAHSIYETARETLYRAGIDPDEVVTLQTGEQPDDRFFARGRVIVTTYDQLLSGLLDGPYGLSSRLHNVNAAAVAGALVVFDEFHLMEPSRAFLTAAAGLHLFRQLTVSVWMTATATKPLMRTLAEAISADECEPTDEEIASLPSVATTTRTVRVVSEPLTVEAVLRDGTALRARTIVLLNTVDRAQHFFEELRKELCRRKLHVPTMLLHARFFKGDRQNKEAALRERFGRGCREPAILVATQVIEAGLDISCDYLHTEVCPMNALVQRAGRCARFEDEQGTIHLYQLPAAENPWLPYCQVGNPRAPAAELTATQELLHGLGQEPHRLDPVQSAAWVQGVHGEQDKQAVAIGWRRRLDEVTGRIRKSAILRIPTRVTDLIREESLDDIPVCIASPRRLPATPAKLEAVTVSRWRLRDTVAANGEAAGWYWQYAGERDWVPLSGADDLAHADAICLRPQAARYSPEVGLQIGEPGTFESPDREEPPRPGYRPISKEGWSHHARAVADHVRQRMEHDGIAGWLLPRLAQRFGISPEVIERAGWACGLLHDLGKLQRGWQHWAATAQAAKQPAYVHYEPLAHTDFDPDDPDDRRRERALGMRRPPHAAAGAFIGWPLFADLLPRADPNAHARIVSACVAAVLAHHGGWLPHQPNLTLDQLDAQAPAAIAAATQVDRRELTRQVTELYREPQPWLRLEELLEWTVSPDNLAHYWPLVAILTRTLRLADQRATAEGERDE